MKKNNPTYEEWDKLLMILSFDINFLESYLNAIENDYSARMLAQSLYTISDDVIKEAEYNISLIK